MASSLADDDEMMIFASHFLSITAERSLSLLLLALRLMFSSPFSYSLSAHMQHMRTIIYERLELWERKWKYDRLIKKALVEKRREREGALRHADYRRRIDGA